MSLRRMLAIGFFLATLSPSVARADGLIMPFFGANFGGNAGESLGEATDAQKYNWGASFGWMGGGVFGVEADIGYSPDFYGKNDAGGSSTLSLMGNLLVGLPFGGQQGFGVRPYGLVGLGILKSDLESFDELVGFDDKETVWDFGGGVLVFFGSHFGIRGDVRYFRTLTDIDFGPIDLAGDSAIDYTRGSLGLVLRF
jgi:Outer membrane protein beta-barrel domain